MVADPMPQGDSAAENGEGVRAGRMPARRGRYALKAAGFLVLLAAAAVGFGFLQFAEDVAAMRAPDETVSGDAIVVLTGGYQRIEHAIDLLKRGAGHRLLISGVNPATTGREISRVTRSSEALFACCVDIGHDAIDTTGNANETARWISERGYHRVFLVTNNYHMPRSLLELRRADPSTEFIPYPVINTDLKTRNWLADPLAVRTLISEYVKYTLARVRSALGDVGSSGLRTDPNATAPLEIVRAAPDE